MLIQRGRCSLFQSESHRQFAGLSRLPANYFILKHYNIGDSLFDDANDVTSSVGVAQLRVDTVRNHAKKRPDIYGPLATTSDEDMGMLLIDPEAQDRKFLCQCHREFAAAGA
jgi:hypothetical protein